MKKLFLLPVLVTLLFVCSPVLRSAVHAQSERKTKTNKPPQTLDSIVSTNADDSRASAKELYLEILSGQRETFNWILAGTAVVVAGLLFATWLYSVKVSKEIINEAVNEKLKELEAAFEVKAKQREEKLISSNAKTLKGMEDDLLGLRGELCRAMAIHSISLKSWVNSADWWASAALCCYKVGRSSTLGTAIKELCKSLEKASFEKAPADQKMVTLKDIDALLNALPEDTFTSIKQEIRTKLQEALSRKQTETS